MKSWRTTLFGVLLAIAGGLQQYGVHVGKVGNGDYLGLVQVVSALGLGMSARDNKVSSEDAGIK